MPSATLKIAIPTQFRGVLEERLPASVAPSWYEGLGDVGEASRDADVLVMGFVEGTEIRAAIESAASARWVSTNAGGVDHYPVDLVRQRGMVLTKGSGVGASPIAESVVLYVLSAAKSFPYYVTSSERHEWAAELKPAVELVGSRALVVGYGAIGRAVGERLKGFGVEVTGVRRHLDGEPGIIGADEWRPRLGEFDWVLITAALTTDTRHMIGQEELSRMKASAWLFNVGRGPLVDQDALIPAINAGRLAGAYLDVVDPEPLPSEHPLWATPNVIITGHSSGRGSQSNRRYADLFLDNLRRFTSGEPLVNVVDLAAGY